MTTIRLVAVLSYSALVLAMGLAAGQRLTIRVSILSPAPAPLRPLIIPMPDARACYAFVWPAPAGRRLCAPTISFAVVHRSD